MAIDGTDRGVHHVCLRVTSTAMGQTVGSETSDALPSGALERDANAASREAAQFPGPRNRPFNGRVVRRAARDVCRCCRPSRFRGCVACRPLCDHAAGRRWVRGKPTLSVRRDGDLQRSDLLVCPREVTPGSSAALRQSRSDLWALRHRQRSPHRLSVGRPAPAGCWCNRAVRSVDSCQKGPLAQHHRPCHRVVDES